MRRAGSGYSGQLRGSGHRPWAKETTHRPQAKREGDDRREASAYRLVVPARAGTQKLTKMRMREETEGQ